MTKIPDDLAFFLLSIPTDGSKFEHGDVEAYRDTESDSVCISVGNWSYVLRAENGCVVDLASRKLNEQHWHTYEQDAWRNELLIIADKLRLAQRKDSDLARIPAALRAFLFLAPSDGTVFSVGAVSVHRGEDNVYSVTVWADVWKLGFSDDTLISMSRASSDHSGAAQIPPDCYASALDELRCSVTMAAKGHGALLVGKSMSDSLLKFFLDRFDLREYDGWYVLYDKVNAHPSDWLPANDGAQRNLIIDALLKLKGVTK